MSVNLKQSELTQVSVSDYNTHELFFSYFGIDTELPTDLKVLELLLSQTSQMHNIMLKAKEYNKASLIHSFFMMVDARISSLRFERQLIQADFSNINLMDLVLC